MNERIDEAAPTSLTPQTVSKHAAKREPKKENKYKKKDDDDRKRQPQLTRQSEHPRGRGD